MMDEGARDLNESLLATIRMSPFASRNMEGGGDVYAFKFHGRILCFIGKSLDTFWEFLTREELLASDL